MKDRITPEQIEREMEDEIVVVQELLKGGSKESRFVDTDTVVTSTTNMLEQRAWAKRWVYRSAVVYLKRLLEREMGDLINDGKLDIGAAASRLGIKYQVLYKMLNDFGSSLEALAGTVSVLGYAVEIRFIPIEKALENETFMHRLTLDGEVEW